MKISHVSGKEQVNFIEVRQYENSIVNLNQVSKPDNSENCTGVWKVKRILEIPVEYTVDYVFIKK
jgi:hypothetical protein